MVNWTTTGWVTPADKEIFTVEDGVIVGRTKGDLKKNEFLVTAKPYGDFILKAKVKIRNGNSGIQFRSKRTDDGTTSGPQCDVGQIYWGSLYGERFGGMMKQAPKDVVKKTVKEADFNDYHIKCVGKHVTIKINGETTVDDDFARSRL